MSDPEVYPLDEALVLMVADVRRAEVQLQGALMLYARQQKLEGAWDISENGRELVKRQC